MKELSRREFILLLIGPGLLILGIYYFAIYQPAEKSLTALDLTGAGLQRSVAEKDRAIAFAKNVPIPPVFKAREEISQINLQIENEKHLALLNAHPASMLPVRWTSAGSRIEAIRIVESTLEDNGLIVISREIDGASQNVLPRELEDFAVAVQNDGNHPVPEVWRINIVGSYTNMLAALDALGRRNVFIVPLSAAMKPLPDDPTRRIWSLWIWI